MSKINYVFTSKSGNWGEGSRFYSIKSTVFKVFKFLQFYSIQILHKSQISGIMRHNN